MPGSPYEVSTGGTSRSWRPARKGPWPWDRQPWLGIPLGKEDVTPNGEHPRPRQMWKATAVPADAIRPPDGWEFRIWTELLEDMPHGAGAREIRHAKCVGLQGWDELGLADDEKVGKGRGEERDGSREEYGRRVGGQKRKR